MKVLNSETCEEEILWPTPEYSADMEEYSKSIICTHGKSKEVLRPIRGGSFQLVDQCTLCGAPIGSPKSQKNLEHTPDAWDDSLGEQFTLSNKKLLESIQQKHLQIQKEKTGRFSESYVKHLASDKWKRTRSKVFKRCGGKCEGCMEAYAEEVHHLTYSHLGRELLFQLVALCKSCHLEAGKTNEGSVETTSIASHPSSYTYECFEGIPCEGCRYQDSDETGAYICGVFKIPSRVALEEDIYCGEALKTFSRLK